VDNSCFIGGISDQTLASGNAVFISGTQLGIMTSPLRFKDDIKLMGKIVPSGRDQKY
jgi:hypothetical protein